jgi:hypothetical protein
VASATGGCRCEVIPCEQSAYPECAGPCPPDQQCEIDPLGTACRCVRVDDTTYKGDWLDYAPSGMPDFEQLHRFLTTGNNPRTICGPTAVLNSFWWFDAEMECDTHHTAGDAAESEPNGSCDLADLLGESPPVAGILGPAPADADWFLFQVPKGGTRACNVILSTQALAAPGDGDTRLALYNGCTGGVPGALLHQNDDYLGIQSEISSWSLGVPVTLDPGTYYVRVDVGTSGLVGSYTLSLGLDCYPLIERWVQSSPDDHSEHNVEASIAAMAVCANTDDPPLGRWRGTRLQDMGPCVDSWLVAKGLRNSYTDQIVDSPTFEAVEREVEKSEDVVLLLGFYWPAPTGDWLRCGGHYVTAAGVDSAAATITLSDPYFNNAEPPPAGNGAPGRVRGPAHGDHAPGVNPPPDHDDAQNVSHDRYAVGPALPGVSQWTLPAYATSGVLTTCHDVANWCMGSSYGQNPRRTEPQQPCVDPQMPVRVAVEAMVDVSPVQTPVCLVLDPAALWPNNLRMEKNACGAATPQPVPYDVVRGKHCGLRMASLAMQVDLGHVQCIHNDVAVDRFDDLSPNDDDCFGLWFYLIRKSADPDYGSAYPGGEARVPSSGGCPP